MVLRGASRLVLVGQPDAALQTRRKGSCPSWRAPPTGVVSPRRAASRRSRISRRSRSRCSLSLANSASGCSSQVFILNSISSRTAAEPLQHRVVGDLLVAAGVLEDPREGRPHAGEGLGALLLGTGADDDEVVEAHLPHVGLETLRVLLRDVYADLSHRFHGARVYLVGGIYARAVRFEAVPGQVAQKPFGHLAPGRVLGAQEQHPLLLLLHVAPSFRSFCVPYPTSTGFGVPPALS